MRLPAGISLRISAFIATTGLIFTSGSLHAYPVPSFDLASGVATSDIVAVANVTSIQEGGKSSIQIKDSAVPARQIVARAVVLRNIKGQPEHDIAIHVLANDSIGYREIKTGTQLLFLRREGVEYVPTSSSYPALPALPQRDREQKKDAGVRPSAPGNPASVTYVQAMRTPVQPKDVEAVIDELGNVVASPEATAEQKSLVLHLSYGLPAQRSFDDQLIAGLNTSGEDVRYRILTALIWRNNAEQMPAVRDLLVRGDLPAPFKGPLLSAISYRLKTSAALPALGTLMQSGDVAVRRASVMAIRRSSTAAAIPLLGSALGDSDRIVQYEAVRGLAEITNSKEWSVSEHDFANDPEKYLAHWKDSVKTSR
jgi:hypothetical protein